MVRKQLCELSIKLPRRVLHLPVSFIVTLLHTLFSTQSSRLNNVKLSCFQRSMYRYWRNNRITRSRRILPGPMHRVRGEMSEETVRLLLNLIRLRFSVQFLNDILYVLAISYFALFANIERVFLFLFIPFYSL